MWAQQAWAISIFSDAVFRFVCINEVPWWLCGKHIQDFCSYQSTRKQGHLNLSLGIHASFFFITRCCDSPHFPSVTLWIISKCLLCISASIKCWTGLSFRVPRWRRPLCYMRAPYVAYRSDLWKAGLCRQSCYVWCADVLNISCCTALKT